MFRNGGLAFGALFGAVFIVLSLVLGSATGSAVFNLAVGSLLLLRAGLPWTRLGLRMTSIAMAVLGTAFVAFGVLSLQDPELARQAIPLLWVLLLAAAPLPLADRQAHPEAWRRWGQAVREASPLAIVLGTHLPKPDAGE